MYGAYSGLRPQDYEVIEPELDSPFQSTPMTVNQVVAGNLARINARAPWLQPQTMLSLAKAGASDAAIDEVARLAGQREIDTYEQRLKQAGETPAAVRWLYTGIGFGLGKAKAAYEFLVPKPIKAIVGGVPGATGQALGNVLEYSNLDVPLKTTTKYGVAALDSFYQIIQSSPKLLLGVASPGAAVAGMLEPGAIDVGGIFYQTSLATLLDARERGIETGNWLPNERMIQEQARRARLVRGVTDQGHAYTPGRGSAGVIFKEGSEPYMLASGFIDAAIMLAIPDPSKFITKGIKGVKGAIGGYRSFQTVEGLVEGARTAETLRGVVPLLSKEDAKNLRKLLKEEAGLTEGLAGVNVNQEKFLSFFNKNPTALKLTEKIIETQKPSEIKELFNFDISNEMAVRLANSTNQSEVLQNFTRGWTYSGPDVFVHRDIGKYRVKRRPFVGGLKNSRMFTEVPKQQVVVNGDEMQSTEAIKNMTNWLRTEGVSSEDITKWLDGYSEDGVQFVGAIRAMTQQGNPVQKAQMWTAFEQLAALTLRQNGIKQPVIKEVLQEANEHVDRVKTYFMDAFGNETDNAHMSLMLDMMKDHLPKDVYTELLDNVGERFTDIQFAQPMQIVEMLNRIQILPNPRDIRRLTRNSLTRRIIDAVPLKDEEGFTRLRKLAITSNKKEVTLTKIADREEYDRLTQEILDLQNTQGPARLANAEKIDQLTDAKKALEIPYKKRVITGEQRHALALLERLQNRIWKPLSLATFGYTVRNGIDAQFRMAFGGVTDPIRHPMDYLHLLFGSKYNTDLKGFDITAKNIIKISMDDIAEDGTIIKAVSGDFDDMHRNKVIKDLMDNLYQTSNNVGFTAENLLYKKTKTGSFPRVNRNSGSPSYPSQLHTDGVVSALGKTYTDPLQVIAAQGLSAGLDEDKILDMMVDYFESNPNTRTVNAVKSLYAAGPNYYQNGQLYKLIGTNLDELRTTNPELYRQWVRNAHMKTVVLDNVRKNTGNLDDIVFMAAHDRVPIRELTQNVPVSQIKLKGNATMKMGAEGFVTNPEGVEVAGIVNRIIDGPGGEQLAVFIPVKVNKNGKPIGAVAATGKGAVKGSREARRIIERSPLKSAENPDAPGLPTTVTREQNMWSPYPDEKFDAMQLRSVNWFFNSFNDVVVRKLEKSPTFRHFYYKNAGKHIDQLSQEEGLKLFQRVKEAADEDGESIRKYLGERNFRDPNGVGRKIENLPNRTNTQGTLTLDELDDYARFQALHDTKDLLYDATVRNNFTDAMRIIAPFAGAWQDVIGRWMKFAASENVQLARTAQRTYSGFANADPDQDGRSFFYRDPTTGEMMFTFPFSGALTKVFTGINAPIVGPVKRFSQGISFYPALGPYAQFAVSKLIPDTPTYQDLRNFLLPYGEKTLVQTLNPVPGAVAKALEVATGNTEDMTSLFGKTYIETLRALSVNPKYNLNDPDSVIELQADAKSKARVLTLIRAANQFVGPVSGSLDFKVPTKIGDQYVSELSKVFNDLQQKDYDTAVPIFLKVFGDELGLYVASKTKAQQEGLETSQEFGNWIEANKDFVKQYPGLSNYFAPKGSEFEFSVYGRQQRRGERIRLTDRQLIEVAQERIGAAKYREARKQFGAFPNEKQREALFAYREFLHEKYPGFKVNVEFTVNEVKNDMITLGEMIDDPRMKNNPITQDLRVYLNERERLLQLAGGKGFTSKKAQKYKIQLFQLGEVLANKNPEFDRLWNRKLIAEVDN